MEGEETSDSDRKVKFLRAYEKLQREHGVFVSVESGFNLHVQTAKKK